VGGLLHGFIGQRARARHDRDLARHVDVPRHDSDLALARGDDAGAVRADQHDVVVAGQRILDPQHVQHRDALGDGDDDLDARIGGFQDRVGRVRRRHVDDGGIGAGVGDRIGHGVEHRQAQVLGAALAGGHAAHDLGAVLDHPFGVEGALGAGEALDDDLGVLVDQNAHSNSILYLTAATALRAPSLMSSAAMIASPEFFSRSLPASTFVPSRRTITGTLTPTSLTAAMMPSAIMSQRTMPPKMLTKIALTLSDDRISLNASVTRSLLAPPPTSRKLAGSPPSSLITSMVAIARPAPLTRQPMLPSMVT